MTVNLMHTKQGYTTSIRERYVLLINKRSFHFSKGDVISDKINELYPLNEVSVSSIGTNSCVIWGEI